MPKSGATKPIVNARILRTGFLSARGPATPRAAILGKTITLLVKRRAVKATAVSSIPRTPVNGATYILLDDKWSGTPSMHNLVRFPAKLHPPLVAWAIGRYTKRGDTILDPFCGCGTVTLEATLRGRKAVGFDVDPYSAMIAKAKCSPPRPASLKRAIHSLEKPLQSLRRRETVYKRLSKGDITVSHFRRQVKALCVPPIPRVGHWFKRYVIVDLLRIWTAVRRLPDRKGLTRFLSASFASILRLCSNADPDTLSGLEVTKRMRAWLKSGRYIDPFKIFQTRLSRNLDPILTKFWDRLKKCPRHYAPHIRACSALDGRSYRGTRGKVHAIITSPPYCSAVEYYRRHQLEHYWLGFIRNAEHGAALRQKYIGRRDYLYGEVAQLAKLLPKPVKEKLYRYLGPVASSEKRRMRAIVKYFVDMAKWFRIATEQLRQGGRLVLVVGDSTVRGRPIRTSKLLKDLVPRQLRLERSFSYLLRNRSMQYSRWNEANVATENVMVFVKR